MRGRRAGLRDDLAALHVLALDTTEQQGGVVTGLAVVEHLVEHLDAGDRGPASLGTDADDLDLFVQLDLAALDTAGDDRTATGDREDVLDRHQERLVDLTLRLRNVLVDGVHQLDDAVGPLLVALESLEAGDAHHGGVVAGELLRAQQLADLHLDQLEDLLVVHHVGLVEGHHDVGHADLTGEQHVLAGLRHGAVGGGDHEDRTVHLRRTGDHVLHVVGVARRVDVRVVTLLGLVLDVRDVDRDTALLLLRRVVDLVERTRLVELRVPVVEHLGDRRGQGGLAVVDVTDGPDVDVRLAPLELRLRHWNVLLDFLAAGRRGCRPTTRSARLCGP